MKAYRVAELHGNYVTATNSESHASTLEHGVNFKRWLTDWIPFDAPPPEITDERILELWDSHAVPVFGRNGINPIVFARLVLKEGK